MQLFSLYRLRHRFMWRQLSGWVVTIVVCIVPVILWGTKNGYFANFNSFYGIMSSLGKLAGLAGLLMYALNFIYATRLRFLENWFGGLNRVYIAHHILGGLALVMLAFHPLFLMLRSVTTSARQSALLVLPHDLTPVSSLFNSTAPEHSLVLQQWAVFFGSLAFIGLVVLMVITFYITLPYRLWLFTHKFLGLSFFLAGLHVLFINSDTSPNGILKFYILGATVIGLAAFIYRSLLGNILVRKYAYRVDGVNVAGGNVAQITLTPIKVPLSYKAGQFIFIRFLYSGVDGVTTEWHPFSISSTPQDPYVCLSVKALGDYTSSLVNLKPGAIAEIEGAYGRFSYSNYKNQNQIWIAGGIGITPFLSMAQNLLADKYYKIDLYYSVRSASELVDYNKLLEISKLSQEKFRIIPYIAENHGRLDVEKVQYYSGSLIGKEIFICGPPPMMKSFRQQLKLKGIPPSVIHTEEFAMS